MAGNPTLRSMNALDSLLAYLRESDAFLSASRLLQWDQETTMPVGGEAARAEVLTALSRLHHERGISKDLEERNEAVKAQAVPGSPELRLTEIVQRDLDRQRKVPSSLVESLTRTTSLAQQAWAKAKTERDFAAFRPHLEEVVRLKREEGACLAPAGGKPYDGLLNDYEYGMGMADWDGLFDGLEPALRTMLPRILEKQALVRERVDNCSALRGPFTAEEQMAVGRHLAASIGYDFGRGRLDVSAHPFSETIHAGDSRITTRLDEHDLGSSFFSVLHETGHALYEQGLPDQWAGTPLGGPVSMAVHESQSRLWENMVGRSREFWERESSAVAHVLPGFVTIPTETFLESVNLVRQSLIRTESDEVTYNLHVLVRYRLEKALIADDLQVKDLPAAWNESYTKMLGVTPEHDGVGVLQDVHWSAGYFGYFPTYSLGNLLSAQFYAAAARVVDVHDPVALLGWLRREIHGRGHALDTKELVKTVCGELPSVDPFLNYLRSKYLG